MWWQIVGFAAFLVNLGLGVWLGVWVNRRLDISGVPFPKVTIVSLRVFVFVMCALVALTPFRVLVLFL